MASHAIARQGTGGTTALALTQIGANIELPSGGPWTIRGVWMQVVKDTAAAAESLAGDLVIQSLSGDLTPDPAPGNFPIPGLPSTAGANSGMSTVPLTIWPCQFTGAGKAVLSLSYRQQLAQATAAQVACGILFGNEVPITRPMVFSDVIRGTQTAAAETSLGTITLSQRATKITSIFADITVDGAWAADEAYIGTIRLASPDADLPPSQYPLARAYSAGDGTPVGQWHNPVFSPIPVDIPVEKGARIECFIDLGLAVTTACTVAVYLGYE